MANCEGQGVDYFLQKNSRLPTKRGLTFENSCEEEPALKKQNRNMKPIPVGMILNSKFSGEMTPSCQSYVLKVTERLGDDGRIYFGTGLPQLN